MIVNRLTRGGRPSADLLPRLGNLGHLAFVYDVRLEVAAARADEVLDGAGRGQPAGADVGSAPAVAAVADAVQPAVDGRRPALHAEPPPHPETSPPLCFRLGWLVIST